jgi:hypothetical protein
VCRTKQKQGKRRREEKLKRKWVRDILTDMQNKFCANENENNDLCATRHYTKRFIRCLF